MGDTEHDELDTELQEEDQTTVEGGESQDTLAGGEGEDTVAGGDAEEEDVVQIGDEEPPASEEETAAPKWVKDLRQRQRELARENAELKAKLGTGQPTAAQKPTLPPKPKLSDPDIDYDEEKFEQARDAWDAKKRDIDAWEANQRKAAEEAQKTQQAVQENYAKSKQALKVKDFQEAESEAAAVLDQVQQAILIKGAANPALIVYALGKNPKKLQELASIKDPVKFTWAAAQLEREVKVTKRTTTKAAPESTVRSGTGSTAGNSRAHLERLEAEAVRTGDRSKVIAYKRQQRQGQK